MQDFIGHHTCSNSGGKAFVLVNGPFLSKWIEPLPYVGYKNPFLGSGFYFWEYDIEQAKRWGETRYGASFYIIQAVIHTTKDNFLDLLGNREQMIGYLELSALKLIKKGLLEPNYKVGKLIETLKKIGEKRPNAFPFTIIRAMDHKHLRFKKVYFFRDDDSFTYIDASHIFCLLEVNDVILSKKEVIFPR